MLNSNRVLNYVKNNLAFPYQFVELTDEQIIEYIQTYTIPEFSYYIPDTTTTPLNLNLDANKVPGKGNEYYITDDQGLEILNVKNIYFSQTNYLVSGHPPLGPLSFGELLPWAIDTEVANMVRVYSQWNYTFEFHSPNRVRISPVPSSEGTITIEYERVHSSTFSTIPNDMQIFFQELCLADIMILIGRIRKKYSDGNLQSPFGAIPLNSEIFDEGNTKKRDLIDKLTSGSLPNIVLSHG